jgi:GAF domain-containing protein
MLREGVAIGLLVLTRSEVQPFTHDQIELVTTFADQAAIAIENVRLFEAEQQRTRELTESLEQQTATSEVLKVISSTPGDLEPVFAAMLERAVRIADAKFGLIYRWENNTLNLVATHNAPPAYAEYRRRSPLPPNQLPGPISRMIVPKSQFTSSILQRSRATLSTVIRNMSPPSKWGVYGRFCMFRCSRRATLLARL